MVKLRIGFLLTVFGVMVYAGAALLARPVPLDECCGGVSCGDGLMCCTDVVGRPACDSSNSGWCMTACPKLERAR